MGVVPYRHRLLLELDLTAPLGEPSPDDPLDRLLSRGRRLLRPTLRALHRAGVDPRVGGLIAKVGGALPWTMAEELRAGVAAFAASGKPTYAWAESFGEGGSGTAAYALAGVFGELWLQPGGDVALLGVAAETTFLRPTIERLWNATQHYRRAFTRLLDVESNRIVHDEHHMLVAAIRENDPDEAERVLFGHIRRTRLQLTRHPEVFS